MRDHSSRRQAGFFISVRNDALSQFNRFWMRHIWISNNMVKGFVPFFVLFHKSLASLAISKYMYYLPISRLLDSDRSAGILKSHIFSVHQLVRLSANFVILEMNEDIARYLVPRRSRNLPGWCPECAQMVAGKMVDFCFLGTVNCDLYRKYELYSSRR